MGSKTRLSSVALNLVATLEKEIDVEQNVSRAILLAEWLARFLFTNYCGIYTFNRVERALVSRFEKLDYSGVRSPVLHIASELYAHGGHTRLMKNLINGMEATLRTTAITRFANRNEIAALLGIDADQVHVFAHNDEVEKVVALASYFIKFERLVLHLHPDDVTAAVALALAKKSYPKIKVFFVNHSDHTFSVAIGAADRILELSAYGLSLAKERGGENRSSFIGIPIAPSIEAHSVRQKKLILTGGSAYKFKPFGKPNLADAFARLLAADPGLSVIAIGPRARDHWWWALKLSYPRRFRTMARLPYQDYLRLLENCALYVDSHPITGGTAFTEALMGGCTVSGRHGGPNGYGLADALRQDGQHAFVAHCQAVLAEDETALAEQNRVRTHALYFHALGAVQGRFRSTLFGDVLCPIPLELGKAKFDYYFRSSWLAAGTLTAVGFRSRTQINLLPHLLSLMIRAGVGPCFVVGTLMRAAATTLRNLRTSQ